jgi:cytochrome c-type biogenesis protein
LESKKGCVSIWILYWYLKRFLPHGNINKKVGSLFLRMAFSAGWTPCVGPILSSIFIYAGSMATIYKGIMLLSVYSLGLADPFLLSALMISNFSVNFKTIPKYMPSVSVVSGILMMIMGILIFTDKLTVFIRYFSAFNV